MTRKRNDLLKISQVSSVGLGGAESWLQYQIINLLACLQFGKNVGRPISPILGTTCNRIDIDNAFVAPCNTFAPVEALAGMKSSGMRILGNDGAEE